MLINQQLLSAADASMIYCRQPTKQEHDLFNLAPLLLAVASSQTLLHHLELLI